MSNVAAGDNFPRSARTNASQYLGRITLNKDSHTFHPGSLLQNPTNVRVEAVPENFHILRILTMHAPGMSIIRE